MADKHKRKSKREEPELVGFLGVGFDNDDGHKRLTRSEHFLLIGGSRETHERMQDTALRVQEGLKRRGKPLGEVSMAEILEIFEEAGE